MTDNRALQQPPDDLVKMFEAMQEVTVGELTTMRENQAEQPLEPDDAFIDFATEDFINKNIRVRPISGVTNKDEKGERQSNISKGAQSDRSDTHDNYNRLAEFELDNQRKLVKKKAADYAEEMRRKQAAEEKKAQKK